VRLLIQLQRPYLSLRFTRALRLQTFHLLLEELQLLGLLVRGHLLKEKKFFHLQRNHHLHYFLKNHPMSGHLLIYFLHLLAYFYLKN
jgi:hypothetical protein